MNHLNTLRTGVYDSHVASRTHSCVILSNVKRVEISRKKPPKKKTHTHTKKKPRYTKTRKRYLNKSLTVSPSHYQFHNTIASPNCLCASKLDRFVSQGCDHACCCFCGTILTDCMLALVWICVSCIVVRNRRCVHISR